MDIRKPDPKRFVFTVPREKTWLELGKVIEHRPTNRAERRAIKHRKKVE